MTLPQTLERPAYGSVLAAVLDAYQAETATTLRGQSFERVASHHGGLTALDRVAQGAMTLQLIRQTLGERIRVLDARYTAAVNTAATNRKAAACDALAAEALDSRETYGEPDQAYTDALVRYWAGHGEPPEGEHAERLGVSVRQLKFWRYGRGKRIGLQHWLDRELQEAFNELAGPLASAGLVAGD